MEIFATAFLIVQGLLVVFVLLLNRAATRNWLVSARQSRKVGTLATALLREEQPGQKQAEQPAFRKAA